MTMLNINNIINNKNDNKINNVLLQESFGTILWKEMADQEHMFTGVAKLLPGGYEPEHIHDPPMVYYIIEVRHEHFIRGHHEQLRIQTQVLSHSTVSQMTEEWTLRSFTRSLTPELVGKRFFSVK